ncbi:sensor domain-containing protein [Kitasatospora azatica]|uniref:sensor domain-containing protein n=1 Tax=Kitasatospora azatica TaxID=58347 RepID=UPI0006897A16|nr:sensor domain-containing protein [Kitasatospora azatica]
MTTTTRFDEYDTPSFWRAPWARESYRELGYVAGSLVTAVLGFSWAVTVFALGAGTLVTVLGLPVLALLLAGARGQGAVERGRIARLLGQRLAAPAPVVPRRPGFWARANAQLADPAGWKAAAYQVVMFPWHVFSFCLSVTLWACSLSMALLPAYNWVFRHYLGWPGYRVLDYQDSHGVRHDYYLSSFWQVAGTSLAGILLIFLTVRITHGLTSVSRAAARAMLAG